ncbi:MAG TPA: helix-turn-helix domain-containing protein [Candidatus Fusicatenibacter intestinigallinarum]|uniref:Helix-turn-helix domain-containing protein n=1 Tax=Candidatus Fusicatenibacter intestinigallinarum TaxID=2838598 RepID=A0A9D2SNS9_9FIRM|nr:helix-turn-helix domain-containing protein [Candidatus Fusicatenibacter intestinigallinarum]
MTQGQRVRELRKALDLTLEKFGNSLGVGKTAISKIEKGENNLTEQMAKAICREFRVNYFWLTEGKGEMFSGTPQDVVDEIAEDYHLDDIDKKIIEKYLELSPEQRQIIKEYLKSIFT